ASFGVLDLVGHGAVLSNRKPASGVLRAAAHYPHSLMTARWGLPGLEIRPRAPGAGSARLQQWQQAALLVKGEQVVAA
ncbi:hypothetical protein ABTE85_23675, partial [Acinetobacter baumannii]